MVRDVNKPLKFISYISDNKGFLDIQAFNHNQPWDIFVDYGSAETIGAAFPEKSQFKYKALNGQPIHVDLGHKDAPTKSMANLSFLIALYPRMVVGAVKLSMLSNYDFEQYGKIEVSTDLRQLDLWTPLIGKISSGEWQFFRISNPFDEENILISIEPLNDSDVDIYVTKGLNTRPTKNIFLKKSSGIGGDEIQISQDD
jgi:hypothetical protein